MTVQSGAAVGGSGSIGGDLAINAGGMFVFSSTDTLSVLGDVLLDTTFGVDDLLFDSGFPASANTFTLIDSTPTDFSTLGIENFGLANAFDFGNGFVGHFASGSGLDLVVVNAIPEPSTVAFLSALMAFGWFAARRRRAARN